MGELRHLRSVLPAVLQEIAQEQGDRCGKHGCLLERGHCVHERHNNGFWTWLEGQEGSSAQKVTQEGST